MSALDELAYDIAAALSAGTPHMSATPIPLPLPTPVEFADVVDVTRYKVSYNDGDWKPGDPTGSEMSMTLVARLTDGRWLSIEAWNDYTGWGCQDGSDVRVAATEDQLVKHGLTNAGRLALGYTQVTP